MTSVITFGKTPSPIKTITTRIFKGQGFWKNAFPNKSDKAEAKQRFDEYVKEQKGYELVLENEDNVLLTDKDKNIKHISLMWGWRPRILDSTMNNDEVKVIKIVMVPSQLRDALGDYTIGGLLIGGIGGAIVGSIIDSFRGPKRSDVSISFEFGEGKFFNDGIT